MRLRYFAIVLGLGMLVGCGHRGQSDLTEEDLAHLQEPLECNVGAECDLQWRRAQAWIARSSGLKIQLANEVVIETFNPPRYSMIWGFRAVREPVSRTRERINLTPNCGEVALCKVSAVKMIANFRRDLRAAL